MELRARAERHLDAGRPPVNQATKPPEQGNPARCAPAAAGQTSGSAV